MAKLYAGQTKLRIRLTANVDITGGTAKIKYQKPDGTKGDWTATIEIPTTGTVYYDIAISGADIPTADHGEWLVWAYLTFADGRSAPGEVFRIKFHSEPN